jgi:hypothetical protein
MGDPFIGCVFDRYGDNRRICCLEIASGDVLHRQCFCNGLGYVLVFTETQNSRLTMALQAPATAPAR